jgi:hypothetical protein
MCEPKKDTAMPQFPKLCRCCKQVHYRYDWELLPLPSGSGQVPGLEMRNCFCGSTLAVEVPEEMQP